MSYLRAPLGVGLTEEEERFVSYELPKRQFDLEVQRFKADESRAKWDRLQAIATIALPLLAFFGFESYRQLTKAAK